MDLFGPPSSAVEAGVQALLVAAFVLAFGYLVADLLLARAGLDGASLWGLALPGAALLALLLMLLHLASGGRVLADAALTRAIVVAAVVALLARKVLAGRNPPSLSSADRIALAAVGVTAVCVWGSPVLRMLPLAEGGDIGLHAGWTEQLLNGEPAPSGPLTGDIPNYYPWLFHALLAVVTHVTPGGAAFHGLAPLQLLLVVGSVLALFALGRAVGASWRAGAGAALFGGMAGGLGFLMLRRLDLVLDPRAEEGASALRYLGDLLFVRSHNVAFSNLSPPYPRDLALVLFVALCLLLALASSRRDARLVVASGVVLGAVGLVHADAFQVGALVAAIVTLRAAPLGRLRTAALIFAPAAAVFALWLVPIAFAYSRLGGFVDTTLLEPVALPPHAILFSWGVSVPFAVAGVVTMGSRATRRGQVAVALVVGAAAALLVAGVIPRLLGAGFAILGRAHRYWPLLHLGVALYAGVGFARALEWSRRAGRRAALATIAVVAALALPSPLVASLALPHALPPSEVLHEAARGDADNVLNVLSSAGRACSVAMPQDLVLTPAFAYTGFRFVLYQARREGPNRARLRWRDIYDTIPTQEERVRDNALLTLALGSRRRWRALAEKYALDLVVVPAERAAARELDGLPRKIAEAEDERFAVMRLGSCPRAR